MLHFYKAELVDADAIAKLVNSAYRGDASRKGWTTEADILDGLRTSTQDVAKIIKRDDAFMLIGVLKDEVVACMSCEHCVLAGHNAAQFGMIAVKPTLQNKGYGKLLMQAAEAMTMREWRVVGFYLTVISIRHELIEFYERLGFKKTGEFKDFPQNPAMWQPKVADLNLLYMAKLVGG
jgi:ribosomal protein S18 acetylase RimI-like enzyme